MLLLIKHILRTESYIELFSSIVSGLEKVKIEIVYGLIAYILSEGDNSTS